MYFLILRAAAEEGEGPRRTRENIRRGDTVVTTGGLVGKVTKVVDDDQIEFENLRWRIACGRCGKLISGVRAKGEPAKEKSEPPRRRRPRADFSAPQFARRIFLDLTGQFDVVFSRGGKALAIHPHSAWWCAVRGCPNFFPEAKVKTWPLWAQAPTSCLAFDLQGGSYLLLEVDSKLRQEKRNSIRCARRPPRAARKTRSVTRGLPHAPTMSR